MLLRRQSLLVQSTQDDDAEAFASEATTQGPCQEPSIRVGNTVLDAAPLLKALPPGSTQDNDEVEVQAGRVYLHLGARRDDGESR